MSTFQKQLLFILVTLLIAILGPLGVDLADATISTRTMLAHVILSLVTTMGALLVKFPVRIWSDEEREEKTDGKA